MTYIDKEKGILIVQILDYNSCRLLGAASGWCIARDPGHFKTYIRKGKQFIVFNMMSPDDRYTMIGITTNSRNKVVDCFDKWNNSCSSYLRNEYNYSNNISHLFTDPMISYGDYSNLKFKASYVNRNLSNVDDKSIFGLFSKSSIGRFINYIVDVY